jgi:hypothetical protein
MFDRCEYASECLFRAFYSGDVDTPRMGDAALVASVAGSVKLNNEALNGGMR